MVAVVVPRQGRIMTRIDEIGPRIYRISTHVLDGPPGGITHNQFLLAGDEPLLFHTGTRRMFAAVHDAVASVMAPERVRWISSTHASRPDEYGALDEWLALAPQAQAVHGRVGCFLCLGDVARRPPRALGDGEVLDLGGLRVRWLDTPHVPGPWEAGVMFEETTRTLLCGDMFSRAGAADVVTEGDIVAAAIAHDRKMNGYALTPALGPTLRRLAQLEPTMLGLMHGPAFRGNGGAVLRAFAGHFDERLAEASRGT